jgi:hypothetical protein
LAEDLSLALDRVAFARKLGLICDPWQEDLLRAEASRVLLNVTRQGGKSSMAAVRALHTALYRPGSLILLLAPSERQSKELFAKVAAFYRKLRTVPAPAAPLASDRKLGMHLPNGSRIEALPGTERTIRGFSAVDTLIVDEAARVDDDLFHAVRPMLAVSGGALVLLSTPYGKRGVFHEAWASGEGWQRFEVPAAQIPRIPASFLEEERRALPAWIYRQEYECSFEETEDQVFGYDLVSAAITDEVTPLFEEAS